MTVATTATTTPTIDDLRDPIRTRLITDLLDLVYAAKVDKSVALAWLTDMGLTPDGDAISHALSAQYMVEGLRDHTIAPADVDPSYTCGRDEARDDLIDKWSAIYDDAVVALSVVTAPEPAPAPLVWPYEPPSADYGRGRHRRRNPRRRLALRFGEQLRGDAGYIIAPAWALGLVLSAMWITLLVLAAKQVAS